MIRSKGWLTLLVALAAFGGAAIVKNEQASRHEARRGGGIRLEKCLAMIGTPAWQLMKPRTAQSDDDRPYCAGTG